MSTATAPITKPIAPVSRAVLRPVDPGNDASCAHCGEPVKFAARHQRRQVIANVYVNARWNRVEHFHEDCYEAAGAPYGGITESSEPLPRRRAG
ncbi:hypothetical protein GHK86_11010 [Acidimicrobiaceae bacterium USS-CC1]|uniref:Uncharacterized protein n=1 Tax=Acidiferrimicrobium australe TaxID=2664430 RepID=A0ABW9QU89_9ACTN|nr:hypothetical protein [Acidiferrimicrobium australe]